MTYVSGVQTGVDERSEIDTALSTYFGHDSFRPGQREVVESVMAGRDTLAVMPTGCGKSLTYQLPAALLPGVTLVLSPLIALMKDQTRSVPPALLSQTAVINSSVDGGEIVRRLRAMGAGRLRLVYAAPERLRQPAFLHALRKADVTLLVVDEAHCISQWGHDFRPDYRAVGRAVEFLSPRSVLAVTATATRTVQDDIERQLGRRCHRVIRPTFRSNLRFGCQPVNGEDNKMAHLRQLCQAEDGSILVYARSRQKCEEIASSHRAAGIAADHYHARLDPEARARAQDRFMEGSVRVMAATIAFGMGVDKQDIRSIIHYNPSASLENYYQEAGRAGRDGKPATCIMMHSRSDVASAMRYLDEQVLDVGDVKLVYEGIRRAVEQSGRSFAMVSPQALAPAARTGRIGSLSAQDLAAMFGRDTERLRPAIPLLEHVGLLRRHTDLADTVSVTLRDNPSEAWFSPNSDDTAVSDGWDIGDNPGDEDPSTWTSAGESLPESPPRVLPEGEGRSRLSHTSARLTEESDKSDSRRTMPAATTALKRLAELPEGPLSPFSVAAALEVAPMDLELMLLSLQDEGLLSYRASGRSQLFEILPPPPGAKQCLERLLIDREALARRRTGAMLDYMQQRCRHASIARYFGDTWTLTRCNACDVCSPTDPPVVALTSPVAPRVSPSTPRAPGMRSSTTGASNSKPHPSPPAPKTGSLSSSESRDDHEIVTRLKAWRTDQARERRVPPYVILSDRTLTAIASSRPKTIPQLLNVPGIGPKRAEEWGEAILKLVG